MYKGIRLKMSRKIPGKKRKDTNFQVKYGVKSGAGISLIFQIFQLC